MREKVRERERLYKHIMFLYTDTETTVNNTEGYTETPFRKDVLRIGKPIW